MKVKLITKTELGFSTLEILIAFVVLILTMTAVIMLMFGNQSTGIAAQTNSEATQKAQAMLEEVQANATLDFALVNPIASYADGIYTKSQTVEMVDSFTKKVTVKVSWKNDNTVNQGVNLSTLITSPENVNGGTTCNSVLSGDWTHPQTLGSTDVGENNGGTDVDIFNGKAYVTADPSADIKDDFYIIDVSNPNINNLPVLGQINVSSGLEAVHVADNYAYVANRSKDGQLQIIDITDTTNPVAVIAGSGYKINAVTGNGAYGKSIYYKNGFVYLGLYNTDTGPEFNIIDVSNPTAPVWRGGYIIGHEVNAIYIRGNYAYIGSPNNSELIVLNISNPTSPTLVSQLDLADNSANGKSIAIVGNTLYLGRTQGASSATKEFQKVDITNPSSPSAGSSIGIGTTINAIAIRDNLAFMLTADTNLGFQIWNLNTGTMYGSKNVQQTSTGGMDCEGNYIYIAQRSNKALQIIGPGN